MKNYTPENFANEIIIKIEDVSVLLNAINLKKKNMYVEKNKTFKIPFVPDMSSTNHNP